MFNCKFYKLDTFNKLSPKKLKLFSFCPNLLRAKPSFKVFNLNRF